MGGAKHILHISSAYHGTNVFDELFRAIDQLVEVKQTVFCGRKVSDYQSTDSFTKDGFPLVSVPIVRAIDSLFFHTRTSRQFKALQNRIAIDGIDVVHAHLLFTDGAVALKLYEKYGIPYVVSVRNTDVNIYFRFFPHLRSLGRKILQNAKGVIFIAPTHWKKVQTYLTKEFTSILNERVTVIPNGVSDFWLNNLNRPKNISKDGLIRFLYVGTIDRNKNVARLVKILGEYGRLTQSRIELKVAGPAANGMKAFLKEASGKAWVRYVGVVKDRAVLKDIYRQADYFVMLSSRETFGLVYIEAMSQGTPVIYTAGQGIDGYFEERTIGLAYDVNQDTPTDIKIWLQNALHEYRKLSQNCIKEASVFSWTKTASKHLEIYLPFIENFK